MPSAIFIGEGDARVRACPGARSGPFGRSARALAIGWAALLLVCASAGIQAAPQRHAQNGPQRYAQNGLEYFVGPAADWVQRTPLPGARDPSSAADGALRYRLLDAQLLLADAAPQRYLRRTIQVLAPAGLEQVARVDITYQPQYETLTLHSIAVLRGVTRTEKLPKLRPELMRRELGLEAGLYDGAATASFTVDDVRVGDSIDVEYTVAGLNPALDGRYSRVLSLAFPAPLDLHKLRVLADPSRPVQVRAVGSSAKLKVSQQGRYKQWQLQLENVTATRVEDRAPMGAGTSPRLEVSEYRSWADVAQWADGLYRIPQDLSPELRANDRGAARWQPREPGDRAPCAEVRAGRGALRRRGDRRRIVPPIASQRRVPASLRRLQGQGAAARHHSTRARRAGPSGAGIHLGRARGPGLDADARAVRPHDRAGPGGWPDLLARSDPQPSRGRAGPDRDDTVPMGARDRRRSHPAQPRCNCRRATGRASTRVTSTPSPTIADQSG